LSISKITGYVEIWAIKSLARYQFKVTQAMKEILHLNKNPNLKKKKLTSKDRSISYSTCHLCQNETFLDLGVILIDGDPKIHYGNCIYCSIQMTKEDAFYIS
jgi:hypothetical protein